MNDPWAEISQGNGKRVNADGKFDFFWVNFADDEPGLILRLPHGDAEIAPLPKLRNIDLSYQNIQGTVLALRLKDTAQREVFAALCENVVSSAEDADSFNAAHARAVRRTKRWHYLLQGGRSKGLSPEEQRGLVGELQVLRDIATTASAATAVEAWRGPLGSSKDFEFPEICIEVKARRGAAKPFISISSADQLADVSGARLFLQVFDVDSAIKPEGMNLHDHVKATASTLEDDQSAFEAWLELLDAAGYDGDDDYDHRRWVVGEHRSFEVRDGFPRIDLPLHEGIDRVSYAISLPACEEFRNEINLMTILTESIVS